MEKGRLTKSAVKPKLFEPNRDLELSVFCTDDLAWEEICDLGVQVAKEHRTAQRLYGWGEINKSKICGAGLRVRHDNTPPRHASIIGWHTEAAERKQQQQLLARHSTPTLLDSPVPVKQPE